MRRLSDAMRAIMLRTQYGETGQAYAEYGMILVIIAIGVIGSLMLMGHHVTNMYQNVSNGLPR